MTAFFRSSVAVAASILVTACAGPPRAEPHVACPDGAAAGPDGTCAPPAAIAAEQPRLSPDEPPSIVAAGDPAPPPPRFDPTTMDEGAARAALQTLRDPRARFRPRSRSLLVPEIQGLERKSAAGQSPPEILRAIADSYAELEAAAMLEGDTRIAAAARKSAIKNYRLLSTSHPNYCASKTPGAGAGNRLGGGCTDEVLYLLSYELENDSHLDEARKSYLQLIQQYPQSRYIPHAYLAFGELFARDAPNNPSKWQFAEQAYLEVLKYPWPGNDVFGLGLLRLAEVHDQKGDRRGAVVSYRRLLSTAAKQPNEEALALPARLVPAWARQ